MEKIRTNKQKLLYLIVAMTVCTAAMCVVDMIVQPGYIWKSLTKIILFACFIGGYTLVYKEERKTFVKLFIPNWKGLLLSVGAGMVLYGIILGAYFLLRNSFDFSGITSKLTADAGVSAENFVFVSLYISIVNSFLEEMFFRGFGFICLKKNANRIFAYVLSALLFSVYHGGMTAGYYNIGIFLLTLAALFIAGLFFNFINEQSENIYASWTIHIFANLGINTVGMILFGII